MTTTTANQMFVMKLSPNKLRTRIKLDTDDDKTIKANNDF